jgi:AraC-like DNA-binding protein
MLIPNMHFEESGKQSKLVETAKKYIDSHPLAAVGEVAQACTTSESALYLCFRKHSDVSINEYKNHVRLEAAKALIISTDTPIEEISQRLGYSSSSYFRKCFGAYFKTTPRDMRSKHSV